STSLRPPRTWLIGSKRLVKASTVREHLSSSSDETMRNSSSARRPGLKSKEIRERPVAFIARSHVMTPILEACCPKHTELSRRLELSPEIKGRRQFRSASFASIGVTGSSHSQQSPP